MKTNHSGTTRKASPAKPLLYALLGTSVAGSIGGYILIANTTHYNQDTNAQQNVVYQTATADPAISATLQSFRSNLAVIPTLVAPVAVDDNLVSAAATNAAQQAAQAVVPIAVLPTQAFVALPTVDTSALRSVAIPTVVPQQSQVVQPQFVVPPARSGSSN